MINRKGTREDGSQNNAARLNKLHCYCFSTGLKCFSNPDRKQLSPLTMRDQVGQYEVRTKTARKSVALDFVPKLPPQGFIEGRD